MTEPIERRRFSGSFRAGLHVPAWAMGAITVFVVVIAGAVKVGWWMAELRQDDLRQISQNTAQISGLRSVVDEINYRLCRLEQAKGVPLYLTCDRGNAPQG